MTVKNNKLKEKTRKTRYAVLVIDMLNDFVYGKMRCARAEKIIPKIKSLLEITKSKKIPVFYCTDAHLPGDYEFKIWGPHALKGTNGAKIIDELKPTALDYVIPKRTYSAFYNTKLESLLKKNFGKKGPDVIIITGVCTDICVTDMAYDAFVRGCDVMVPEDAVTAFREQDHHSALEYMKKNYGAKILKTSKIIDILSNNS